MSIYRANALEAPQLPETAQTTCVLGIQGVVGKERSDLGQPTSQVHAVADCAISVSGLLIDADIGVHPHEIGKPQPLELDIELQLELPEADSIESTLNYESVVALAKELALRRTNLIETFAKNLAVGLIGDAIVNRVSVTVRKPRALIGCIAACRVVMDRNDVRW